MSMPRWDSDSKQHNHKNVKAMKKVFSIIALSLMMSTTVSAENVTATIHADQGKYKINKEIYGQ